MSARQSRLVIAALGFGALVFAAVLLPSGVARAADLAERPRIGLVLSGGGARGLTHVGVLKVLERERIPVDVIAGTSMGAIVGGLYASGLSAQELEREVLALDWDAVFASRVERTELPQRRKEQDFEVSPLIELGVGRDGLKAPIGPVSSRGLEAHLRRLTLPARRAIDFDRLPTPFRAVATDMETGQPVILKSGDLATALRSSMSVPGVFAPVEVDGRILGDGGLVNNTPVDVARDMGASRLIVVNIGTPLSSRDTLSTLTGVTAQMINILTEQNVQRSLATLQPQDVLIAPVLGDLTAADFNRAPEFVNFGEIQAEALVLRMQDLKVSEAEYARWVASRRARVPPSQALQAVRFEGSQTTRPERMADDLETQAGAPFDVAAAERDLRRLAATGDYIRTDYRLEPAGQGEGLVFRLEDKPWGPNYLQLGLDFSADTNGSSQFNLKLVHTRHWLDDRGSEWRNFLRLGSSPSLSTELWRPMGWELPDGLQGFTALSAQVGRQSWDIFDDPQGEPVLSLARRQREVAVEVGFNWRELGEFRLGWLDAAGHDTPELIGTAWRGVSQAQQWRERGWRLRAVFDQLDSAYFPRQGWRVEGQLFEGDRRNESSGQSLSGDARRWDTSALAAWSWGDHTVSVGGRLAGGGGLMPSLPRYGLGGFQNLSGYAAHQVSGQQVLLARLVYAHRLGAAPLTRGVHAGVSLEAGNAWGRWSELGQGGLRRAGSLYIGADTVLGPVYAAIGAAEGVRPTLMLFVGRP